MSLDCRYVKRSTTAVDPIDHPTNSKAADHKDVVRVSLLD